MRVISKEVRYEEPLQPDTPDDIAELSHADPPGGFEEERRLANQEEAAHRLEAGQSTGLGLF
jgi:hypothetical protein